MSADCCSPRRRAMSVGLAYTPAALLALLLPKCPLCLAPLLAAIGVGVLPYDYTLVVAISIALGTLVLVTRAVRARRRTRRRASAR
jgi:hypothetical protein